MATAARPKRTNRLNIRATRAEKKLLETAAARKATTVSDFVLESACTRAEDLLAQARHFELPTTRWKAFVAALDRPVRPKPGLRKLLSEPGVLDR